MSNINLTCDVCGRQVQGYTWVNGMRFCAKCYQETFGASKDWQLLDKDKTISEQRKQISDLEAKLAESEEKIKKAHRRGLSQRDIDNEIKLNALREDVANKEKRIVELKQQLAEKEKEIEQLNNRILISQLQAPKEQILNVLSSQCIQHNPEQDKISFAVEQLEKAINIVENVLDDALKNNSCNSSYYDKLLDLLDNQIKELKGERK